MSGEKNHIFLTGEIQCGKSYLLQRVLRELSPVTSGFTTKWGETYADGNSNLYLRGVNNQIEAVVAHRTRKDGFGLNVFTDVFETKGVETLEEPMGLVIMDELGRFESKAPAFRAAVFRVLDSDMPVFGVVRDMDVPFLNDVRNHPKTKVIRVTKENRDELFYEVLEIIREIYSCQVL